MNGPSEGPRIRERLDDLERRIPARAVHSRSEWKEVTKSEPCPICEEPDWCGRTADGACRCMREHAAPEGWRIVKATDKEGGTTFRRLGAMRSVPRVPQRPKAYLSAEAVEREMRRFRAHMTPALLRRLASSLKLPVDSLRPFDLGYCRETGRYAIMETDGAGTPVGIHFRPLKGRHGHLRGSRRGLTGVADLTSTGRLIVAEGWSDCVALRSLGFENVVSHPSASGGVEFVCDLVRRGEYREVVIFADRDDAGRKGAATLAAALSEFVRVRVVAPAAPHKDAREWVNSGAKRQDVQRMIDETQPQEGERAEVVRLSDVEPKKVEWLWQDRIVRGKLNLIAGDPGLGKSFLTLAVAAAVTTGEPWPGTTEKRPKGSVLLLNAEDDAADTIRPRLESLGGDLRRVHVLNAIRGGPRGERMFDLTRDVDHLRKELESRRGCELVVIDPVNAYLPRIDSHRDTDIRSVLAPLAKLAADTRVAVVAVSHLNKAVGVKDPIYRVMGSIGYVGAARTVWAVVRDDTDPALRLWLPAKNNLAADRDTGLGFYVRDGQFAWHEAVKGSARDHMQQDDDESGRATDVSEAADWLRDALADGPVPTRDLKKAASDAGHSWRTVRRAKHRVGVAVEKEKGSTRGHWWWSLVDA